MRVRRRQAGTAAIGTDTLVPARRRFLELAGAGGGTFRIDAGAAAKLGKARGIAADQMTGEIARALRRERRLCLLREAAGKGQETAECQIEIGVLWRRFVRDDQARQLRGAGNGVLAVFRIFAAHRFVQGNGDR